jgi:hypothetical protein
MWSRMVDVPDVPIIICNVYSMWSGEVISAEKGCSLMNKSSGSVTHMVPGERNGHESLYDDILVTT